MGNLVKALVIINCESTRSATQGTIQCWHWIFKKRRFSIFVLGCSVEFSIRCLQATWAPDYRIKPGVSFEHAKPPVWFRIDGKCLSRGSSRVVNRNRVLASFQVNIACDRVAVERSQPRGTSKLHQLRSIGIDCRKKAARRGGWFAHDIVKNPNISCFLQQNVKHQTWEISWCCARAQC